MAQCWFEGIGPPLGRYGRTARISRLSQAP
jgi:hypothetical protein